MHSRTTVDTGDQYFSKLSVRGMSARQIWVARLSNGFRGRVLPNETELILPRTNHPERAKRAECNGDCRVNALGFFPNFMSKRNDERALHRLVDVHRGGSLEGPTAPKQEVSARRIFLRTDIHW